MDTQMYPRIDAVFQMYKAELFRFRAFGLLAAFLHLVVLRGVMSFGDLFVNSLPKMALGLLTYAGLGLIFGLYQWGTYKKVGRWTYLIHRPMAPVSIFGALAGAAATWLVVILALPLGLIAAYADIFRPEWVDSRFYATAPFVLGLGLVFYLMGSVMLLHPSRAAVLIGALTVFFLSREVVGGWVFVIQAVVLLWLGFVGVTCFKPDLKKHLSHPAALVASALPMQYALLWMLFFGGNLAWSTWIAFEEHGVKSFAAHAWNDYFPPQTVEFLGYRNELQALAHGLERIDHARGVELAKQIELAERFEIRPALRKPITKGQLLHLDRTASLVDTEHEVSWSVSHDRLLLHGRNLRTGAPVGWMGKEGLLTDEQVSDPIHRFSEPPTVVGEKYLMTTEAVYEFESRRQRIHKRFQLPAGQSPASAPGRHGSVVSLLSDGGFYLFDAREWQRRLGEVQPLTFVELPGDIRNLSSMQVAELIDGFLFSFAFGTQSARGFKPAEQVMAEWNLDGGLEILGRVPLRQGTPTWLRHQLFIYSPLMQTAHDQVWAAIGPYRNEAVSVEPRLEPLPPKVWAIALGLGLFSAYLAFLFGRRRGLAGKALMAWTVGVLFSGLPGLITFFMLSPRQPVALPTAAESESRRIGVGAWAGAGVVGHGAWRPK